MARIAIGGFHHETNTFASVPTTLDDFRNSASYPALPRGPSILEELRGQEIPIGGFVTEAERLGHELVPTLWAGASPAAAVTQDAFETIAGDLLAGLEATLPVDAVYLCLHGAMVTERYADGEGELLRRVRALVGDLPLVASLDFHANVSPEMLERATALVAFRTYPHVDMAETGGRAARLLDRILREGRPAKVMRKAPFLIPLVWQCTSSEPARSLLAEVAARESGEVWSLSLAPGFPLADVPFCGPAVLGYGADADAVERAVTALHQSLLDAEPAFAGQLYGPDEAVRRAMAAYKGRPIILADTQDNPGAGAPSDSVWLMEALVRAEAGDAALAIICDPGAAQAAHQAGPGADVTLGLGAGSGAFGGRPFHATYEVEAVSDGSFPGEGRMSRGLSFRLGPTALLRIGGVRVVVASRKTQANDQAIFRHLGLDPAAQRILALKSSVHFRDDFEPIAGEILIVAAPGPNIADHRNLPYRNLPGDLRVMPLGPVASTG